MAQTSILPPEQLYAFDRTGVLHIEGLLCIERVRRARGAVLRRLEQLGFWKDGAWRLGDAPRPLWPARARTPRRSAPSIPRWKR